MLKHSHSFFAQAALLVLVAFFGACSNKVEKADAGKVATFYVDNIEGSSEISKVDSVYAIPKERIYNFKACIKDIMQSKAIQGHSFMVQGGVEEKIAETDEQGCLNWNESIEYNFLAQSSYIKIHRTIVANGLHKGSAEVQFAINPWAHGDEDKVVDPKKKSVVSLSEHSEGTSAFMAGNSRSPLWAISPRVSIVEQEFSSAGAQMILKYQTKLSLVLKNAAGQNIQYPVSNGAFDVEVVLYNSAVENGKESLITLASLSEKNVSFNQDTLIAEFPFTLNKLPTKGQILLGVKITASSNEIGLDPFESVYMVSSTPTVKTESIPVPAKNVSFGEIKAKLFSDKVEIEKDKAKSNDVLPGLEVEKLDIRFFKIGSETTTERQVFFNVKACIKSNLDKRPIRDEQFNVQTTAGKAIVAIKSNQDGCISWDDSIWHKVFAKERFIKKVVVISHAGFNLNQKIDIILNPWDSNGNFGRDQRFVEDFNSLEINPSSENAKILIDNYNFSVVNYKYEINKSLDLTIVKNGILSLSAKVVNHSSLSYGRSSSEPLRDGKYLLRWAVVTLDGNDKADSVISTDEKAVTIFGGDLKTDVSFKVSAFDKLNTRARLVIALYTIKENKNGKLEIDLNSGLEASPFVGTIVLNRDEEGQKMVRIEDNLGLGKGDLFARLSSLGSGTSNSTIAMDKVLSSQNLKKINLAHEKETLFLRDGLSNPLKFSILAKNPAYYHEAEQKPAVSSAVLAGFAKSGKLNQELALQFCSFWFNDYFKRLAQINKSVVIDEMTTQRLVQSCVQTVRKDPARFFKTDKKLVVKKVGGIKYLAGTTTNFSVGNSFSVAKAEASSKTHTWSWTNSVGLSLELFDIFKIGSTGAYAIASASSKTDTTSTTSVVNASTYMFMQTSTFNVELTAYEECSAIRLNPELFTGKGMFSNLFSSAMKSQEIAKVATSGFFICTGLDNTTPLTKKENYYLVSQDMSSKGGEQDAYNGENQQLFMTFRGQKDLANFLSIIQASLKSPTSSSTFENTSGSGVMSTARTLGGLPTWSGVYSDGE